MKTRRIVKGTTLGLLRNGPVGPRRPGSQPRPQQVVPGRHLGRYTILRAQELARLLREHPDMYVILDSKYARLDIYKTMLRHAPQRSLRERIFPHIQDRAQLSLLRTAYRCRTTCWPCTTPRPRNRYDDPIVGDFVNRYRAPAVMMWWRNRNPALSLAANVYVHSLGDPAQIQRFWNARVGVYSDNPFPPLSGTTTLQQEQEQEQLIMPDFPKA